MKSFSLLVVKKIAFIAPILAMLPSLAAAQLAGKGFYLGLEANAESMTVKSAGASQSFGSGGSLTVNGGYEWGYGKSYALLTGAFYDLDYYLQGGSGSNGTRFTKGTETLNQKIKWGAYLAPGVYVTESSLIYAKLIYASMKTDPEGERSSSPNFQSVGYGLGLRQTVFKDYFVTLEWAALPVGKDSFSSFRNGAEISPGLSMFSLGFARRF